MFNTVTEPAALDLVKIATAKYRSESLSAGERERLILEHLPGVRQIARRIIGRLPVSMSLDDLVSTGTLGLMSAIDNFDSTRNTSLATYAAYKIKGHILDSLRQQDWAPPKQRARSKDIQAAISAVEQRTQRSSTEQEVAAELQITVDCYHRWQVKLRGLNLVRLESGGPAVTEESRNLLGCISDTPEAWPSAVFERKELRNRLAKGISGVPVIEQTILGLHYSGGLTLDEVSKVVGLDASRVSLLRARAIRRLRMYMAEHWPSTGTYASLAAMFDTEVQ